MIRLDFDFDSKLKQLETSQRSLQEHLVSDIQRMKEIVGHPLLPPAIPQDLIMWADELIEDCFANDEFAPLKKECPRILKYITVSTHLSEYLSDTVIGPEIRKLLNEYPRERPLSNLLLHFFTNFLSIENEVISAIKSLLLAFFKENTPRLALTQFYVHNKLNIGSNRSSLVNKVLANILTANLFSGGIPAEVRGTDFYYELLIATSGRIHNGSDSDKNSFWSEIDALNITELHKICIAKYTIKATETDKDFCKSRAMKHIGDPSQHQLWRVTDKYRNRANDIEQARLIIEIWINQQFITAFFQTMQASNRGDFWLTYVKHMEKVQILGSISFLEKMKRQYPSAKQYLNNRERFTQCGRSSEACVFIHFKKHIIILFDKDNKAGIIRLKDDPTLPQFRYYGNVTSIVDSRIDWAYRVSGFDIYNIQEFGRYRHIEHWEYHLREYLKQKIL